MKTMAVVSFWAAPARAPSTSTLGHRRRCSCQGCTNPVGLQRPIGLWTMVHAARQDFALVAQMKMRATTSQTPRWTMAHAITLDECGVCGGDGILPGECDCDGNVIDDCGVCGGPGIPEGDCDCEGNGSTSAGFVAETGHHAWAASM